MGAPSPGQTPAASRVFPDTGRASPGSSGRRGPGHHLPHGGQRRELPGRSSRSAPCTGRPAVPVAPYRRPGRPVAEPAEPVTGSPGAAASKTAGASRLAASSSIPGCPAGRRRRPPAARARRPPRRPRRCRSCAPRPWCAAARSPSPRGPPPARRGRGEGGPAASGGDARRRRQHGGRRPVAQPDHRRDRRAGAGRGARRRAEVLGVADQAAEVVAGVLPMPGTSEGHRVGGVQVPERQHDPVAGQIEQLQLDLPPGRLLRRDAGGDDRAVRARVGRRRRVGECPVEQQPVGPVPGPGRHPVERARRRAGADRSLRPLGGARTDRPTRRRSAAGPACGTRGTASGRRERALRDQRRDVARPQGRPELGGRLAGAAGRRGARVLDGPSGRRARRRRGAPDRRPRRPARPGPSRPPAREVLALRGLDGQPLAGVQRPGRSAASTAAATADTSAERRGRSAPRRRTSTPPTPGRGRRLPAGPASAGRRPRSSASARDRRADPARRPRRRRAAAGRRRRRGAVTGGAGRGADGRGERASSAR